MKYLVRVPTGRKVSSELNHYGTHSSYPTTAYPDSLWWYNGCPNPSEVGLPFVLDGVLERDAPEVPEVRCGRLCGMLV